MEHQEPLSANVAKAIITKCMANINTLRMQSEEYMIALSVALDRAVLGQLFQSVLSRSPLLASILVGQILTFYINCPIISMNKFAKIAIIAKKRGIPSVLISPNTAGIYH